MIDIIHELAEASQSSKNPETVEEVERGPIQNPHAKTQGEVSGASK